MRAIPGFPSPRGRRHRAGVHVIVIGLIVIAVTGCPGRQRTGAGQSDAPGPAAARSANAVAATGERAPRFASARWDFSIEHPAGWQVRNGFRGGYLASNSWKTYAAPDSQGTRVVALAVPGSNHVIAAEIRIGVSRSPEGVRHCTEPPSSVRSGSIGDATIDGIRFTRFDAGDAAMSHYLDVRSYRTVHEGTCYAIDLVVFGTNPEVYSPPATPPFTREQAFAQMQQLLQGFRFTH